MTLTCVATSLPVTKPPSARASGPQARGADGGAAPPWQHPRPSPAREPPAAPPVPAQPEPEAARWGELARAAAADTASCAEFSEALRARSLPKGLDLARLQGALLSCVEGLYRDRVRPAVGEVQRRLRGCGWHAREAGAAAAVAARDPGLYHVVPPQDGEPPAILLRYVPRWFAGWVDPDAPGALPAQLGQAMHDVGTKLKRPFKGGVRELAAALRERGPPCLQRLCLGELQHHVALALGAEGLLCYDPQHGGRIRIRLHNSAFGAKDAPGGFSPPQPAAAAGPIAGGHGAASAAARSPGAPGFRAPPGLESRGDPHGGGGAAGPPLAGAAPAAEGGGGSGGAVQGDEVTAAQAQMMGGAPGHELQLHLQQYLQQYQGLAAKNPLAVLESLAGFATMAHGAYGAAHALEEFSRWCAAAALEQLPQASDYAAAQYSLPSFAGGVVHTQESPFPSSLPPSVGAAGSFVPDGRIHSRI